MADRRRIRFYVNIPEYRMDNYLLCAYSGGTCPPPEGHRRVAFDVVLPDTVWKDHDDIAVVEPLPESEAGEGSW
jgi:hypothetical protein